MADTQAPDRLPANFDFSKPISTGAPDRLPANFDFGAQPQTAAKPDPPGFLDSYLNTIKGAFTGVYNDLRPHSRAEKLAAVHDAVDNADKYVHGTDEEKAAAKDKMIGALPGGGTALKVRDGNYAGAAGDVAGMATLGAATHLAAGDSAVAAGTRGALKGAAQGAVEPINYGPLKLPIPASWVGGGAGAAAAAHMGIPTAIGTAVGAATPIVKGAIRGAKAALADRLAAIGEKSAAAERAAAAAAPKRLPAAPDASFVRSVPAEAPPPPQPKGLLGPSRTLITPAPEDASFVRSVPAEYPQVEGGRAPAAAAPAPPAELPMDLLDEIAKGQAKGKPFAKLAPEDQEAVRAIARRIQDPTPLTEQPAPLPARRAPDPGPGPSVSAEAPQTPVRQPAPAATPGPAAPQPAEVNRPETPPVLENARSPYLSSGELKSPQLRAMEIIGDNRGKRASAMAKALHENGIPLSDAKNIDATQWKSLNDSTGGKDPKGPSQETIDATLSELGKLGRSPGQAALQDAVQRNGVRVAGSRAKLAPQ